MSGSVFETIDVFHEHIHDGIEFYAPGLFQLAAGHIYNFYLQNPANSGVVAHMQPIQFNAPNVAVAIYKNPTFDHVTGAVDVPIVNLNQASGTTSKLIVKALPAGNIVTVPGGANPGIIMDLQVNGNANRAYEYNLPPSADLYACTVTNLGASTIWIASNVLWYEVPATIPV